jgi:hypothetical protein
MYREDDPNKQEKAAMAESMVAAFPVLKGTGKTGYVSVSLIYVFLTVFFSILVPCAYGHLL